MPKNQVKLGLSKTAQFLWLGGPGVGSGSADTSLTTDADVVCSAVSLDTINLKLSCRNTSLFILYGFNELRLPFRLSPAVENRLSTGTDDALVPKKYRSHLTQKWHLRGVIVPEL